MESGNPLLERLVLGLTKAERPGSASCLGLRRRRPLHRPLLRAFSPPLRGQPHLAFPARARPGDIRRHLLSQDLIYVGGGSVVSLLASGRRTGSTRSWRMLGSGSHPLRPLGRVAVLVRGGGHRLPRGAATARGLGLLPFSTVSTRRKSDRRQSYHRLPCEGMRRATPPRMVGRVALRRRGAEPVVASRPEAPVTDSMYPGSGCEMRIAPTTSANRGRAGPPTPRRCPPRSRRPDGAANAERSHAGDDDASPSHPHAGRSRLHLASAHGPSGEFLLRLATERAARDHDLHPARPQAATLRADRPLLQASATGRASLPTSPLPPRPAAMALPITCSPRT